ncbi:helitron helicase-like domain-containing protein [Nocardia noduli]|uniref:helitron helicase-like domain-containing protein n=1 Tax=Nocardia noduli TaxID=2815722 RepID=UPI001C22FE61|nr:helitron helicase-like domain-containing protein [Nocardia noduli]
MSDLVNLDTDTDTAPVRQTAAQRRALPDFTDIAHAAAEEFGVCVRPITMASVDPITGKTEYLGSPCKATIASVCKPCADKARWLRITQGREGWHVESEPVDLVRTPSKRQTELLTARADLVTEYRSARSDGDDEMADAFAALVGEMDQELRDSGIRGRLPALDPKPSKRRARSTRRRQDVPNLPRQKVTKKTIGKIFGGKHRPSMMVTLTMPSYGSMNQDGGIDKKGKECGDGSPQDPDTYDYTSAARDIVFFAALIDRWIQNLRRCLGYDIQYFAAVEPQRRGAPHIHILLRSAISRDTLKLVTAATYHQVWWPHFDPENEVYSGEILPVWDWQAMTFVDPDSGQPLTGWDEALDILDTVDDLRPAYTVRFGERMDPGHIKGHIPGNKADAAIGYVTKYLTKAVSEVLETDSVRTAIHYDRLHAELQHTPCSPKCPVWLRYGIVPKGASDKTVAGKCKGKAHRRDTLGLPGRRVLVSRRWSGKTLPDHKADRIEFVRQLLASVGIVKPDNPRLIVRPVQPGDQNAPPRDHLILSTIAQRKAWRVEYDNALLAAGPQAWKEHSAIKQGGPGYDRTTR